MTLYIRRGKNKTLLDVEFYTTIENDYSFVELSSTVMIEEYSKFLLENIDRADEIIEDFEFLNELRGWLWESFFIVTKNTPASYDSALIALREILNGICEKYSLYLVED